MKERNRQERGEGDEMKEMSGRREEREEGGGPEINVGLTDVC